MRYLSGKKKYSICTRWLATSGERLSCLVLSAYRSLREGHEDCVDGAVTQQQREAHAEPLRAREDTRGEAEEQRRPEVVVGKAARKLEAQ